MIAIFRGDDTTFQGNRRVRVNIVGNIPLTGCSAVLTLCGVEKSVADVSTGTFYVDFTAAETAAMPCGVQMATVAVYDAQSHRRTATNTLCVNVTDRVGDAYRTAEESANVSLDAPVRWVDVLDAPTINGVALSGDMSSADLGIKGIVNDGGGAPVDLPENYTPDQMRTLLNRLAALVRASMQALAAAALAGALSASTMAAEVEYARLGSLYSMSNVVTRVDLSGLAASTDVYTKAETDARIVELAPTPTEIDPTVPAWAKADTPPASGLTTNDVCAIITNEVVTAGEWRISPISPEAPMPPNAMIQWTSYDATDNPYTRQTGWDLPYTVGWFLIFGASHEKLDVFSYDFGTDPDALNLEMSSGDTGYSVTATRAERRNALGLVVAADLPDVKPAAQLLLKGEDGNVYVVKVDSDGVLRYYRQEDN